MLFCLELGRSEQGSRGEAGLGVSAPRAASTRTGLGGGFRPQFWTASIAHTSRVAGMGKVPRVPGLAWPGHVPSSASLGGFPQVGGPRAVEAIFRRVLGGPLACRRLRVCRSATQTVKTEWRELGHFLHKSSRPPAPSSSSHPPPHSVLAAAQARTRFYSRF